MVYISNSDEDRRQMLAAIGVESFDELIAAIPEVLRADQYLQLPEPLSELDIEKEIREITGNNRAANEYITFLGGGAYDHFIPRVVDFLISRSEFYTAYTPYQAEVSQGTLQAMYEYQSMICALTGMDVSNASMYDGATAMAEAAMMARNINRKNKILVSDTCHPHYLKVLDTYAESLKLEIVNIRMTEDYRLDMAALNVLADDAVSAIIVQSPNFFGYLEDVQAVSKIAHDHQALFIQGTDPISLALLKAPGDYETDIVFAEGQVLGNHLNFGGPYLGIFAAKEKYVRKMPGRIIGATTDTKGRRGFVLNLQTREQHIRREKATSNICTNQGLNALAATIYLALMGKNGLKKVAELTTQKTHYLAEKIAALDNYQVVNTSPFFKEFVVKTPVPARELSRIAVDKGILAGIPLERFFPEKTHELLVAVTEKRSKKEMDAFVAFLNTL